MNRPTQTHDSTPQEGPGSRSQPARIELTTGETIDATHHYTTSDGGWVIAHIDEHAGTADVKIPRESVERIDCQPTTPSEKSVVSRSDADVDASESTDDGTVSVSTDGGLDSWSRGDGGE